MTDKKENEKDETIEALEGVFIPADENNFDDIPNQEGQAGSGTGQGFDPEIAGIVSGMVGMLFSVAEKNRGLHWHVEPEQLKDYGETCAIFYEKQFGSSELSPAWALVGASCALFLMPVMGEIELAGQGKKENKKGDESGNKPESET